jgi:hypothetical protein
MAGREVDGNGLLANYRRWGNIQMEIMAKFQTWMGENADIRDKSMVRI